MVNITMEYVYKLNLPAAKDIFTETFSGFNDDNLVTNYQFCFNLSEIIKPEWLKFKNLKWDHLLYFKKSNFEGQIHTDIGLDKTDLKCDFNPWGITWIYDGSGLLEFWDHRDLIEDKISAGSDNNKRGIVKTYSPTAAPAKSYKLQENGCYLVNGKYPHRASGYSNRRVISLRATKSFYNSWENITNMFHDTII